MFARLTNLGFKRSPLQAFGFCLAYLFLFSLTGGLASVLAEYFGLVNAGFLSGAQVGATVAIPLCLAMAIGIGVKKVIRLEFKMFVFYVTTGICAVFLGALLGLVIPACLTTLDSAKKTLRLNKPPCYSI